ncbi:hypothetical protein KY311_05175, partial [Candidatus Woesearchaeota archaeon]|nr:hypothetical protein [Candidatus Woesearchaeota archaeon]
IAKYEAVLVSAEPMGWRAQVGYFKTDKDGKPVSEKRTIDVVLNGPGLSKAARKIAGQVYLMASRE